MKQPILCAAAKESKNALVSPIDTVSDILMKKAIQYELREKELNSSVINISHSCYICIINDDYIVVNGSFVHFKVV